MKSWLILGSAAAILLAPLFSSASVVINEVLFNPSGGSDTGLEKIELYNPDAAAQDMSSWELYPDGIGYFVFPNGFSLATKSLVVIHLHASGTNDAANLYHSSATSNMGNSSGSVALFKPGGRNEDTIIDFVRYHKAGASERKTWESYAAEAGLWTVGTFVDVANLSEGNSIGLVSDGVRQNAASWKIYTSPSIGGANAAASGESSAPAATSTPATSPAASSGAAPKPSLGADAGPDATVIAGVVVTFRGMAFGLDGEPLPGARFLWNFGDGWIQEGKSLNHVYYFPGTYQANLSVSSGEYSGSDWRIITVIPPAITISEAKPGDNGFVELFNASDQSIDLSGINLTDDARNIFRIPAGTVVGAGGVIVFANVISGLNPSAALILRDARSSLLDEAEFSALLPRGASFERSGEKFVVAVTPTPGKFIYPALEQNPASNSAPNLPVYPITVAIEPPAFEVQPAPNSPTSSIGFQMQETGQASSVFMNISRQQIFFAASLILGLAAALGFFLLKRGT